MEEELISIVVPIYNVEKYLERCITSIRNQTYKNIEIILVDDGSEDRCPELCDKYKQEDKRIIVIHKENGGLSDARNAGIDVAKGKYITFVDSDDYIDKKFVQVLLSELIKNNAEISMCGIKRIDENEQVIERIPIPEEDVLTGEEVLLGLSCFATSNIVAWNKLYDINLFKDIRYPKGKIHEDEFTTYKILYKTKLVAITKNELYYYRQNENSITNKKFDKKRLNVLEALEERTLFFKQQNNEKLYCTTLNRYLEIIIYMYSLGKNQMSKQDRKNLIYKYKELYNIIKKGKYTLGAGKKGKQLFRVSPKCYILLQKIKNMKENKIKNMLKKIKKTIIKVLEIKKYKRYRKECLRNGKKEFLIFNAPIHGNIGDHAIIYAEEQLLKKINIEPFEIPTYKENYYFEYIKKHIRKDAIISITGGGFIGSQWIEEQNLVNKVLREFKEHKIVIFPCTIYFKDDEQGKEELSKFKENIKNVENINIFAREEKTYRLVKEKFNTAKAYLCPDIVLSLDRTKKEEERNGILICLRKDEETIFTSEKKDVISNIAKDINKNIRYTDTVINKPIEKWDREKTFIDKLQEFEKSQLVITDRLHGMIFAYLTNTPCIVFSNYNYKVQGVYNWIKDKTNNIIYETDVNNIRKDIEKLYNNFENTVSNNTELDFAELKELIKNCKEIIKMDKMKRFIDCYIPTETCNFRCQYCYIAQHRKFNNKIVKFEHKPEFISKALSKDRLGGTCMLNLCAGGETLIAEEIIDVIKAILEEGHYVMVVTNGSLTKRFEKIAEFPKELLNHLFFKFSFHYLELIRLGMLDKFFDNIKMMKEAGASFTVEITPNDELEPYIDEIKKVSIEKLGALPHITIGRKDSGDIPPLTEHKFEEYIDIWKEFKSDLFNYKATIFGKKRKEFCYAGNWSVYLNLATGDLRQCYCGIKIDNIYEDINRPINFLAIGHNCTQPHCYNGHAFLTFGDIPELDMPTYDKLRNRKCNDGTQWLTPDMEYFMQSKLEQSNQQYDDNDKRKFDKINRRNIQRQRINNVVKKFFRYKSKKEV